jgi:hypothetical protein
MKNFLFLLGIAGLAGFGAAKGWSMVPSGGIPG